MERKILLRGARQLLTLRGPNGPRRGSAMGSLGLIDDGAILIVDGAIAHVGPSRRVENLAEARDAVELGAEGRLVMPGFVDCRTHLVSGPPLVDDYERDLAAPCEEQRTDGVNPALVKGVRNSSRPRLELLARKAIRQFVRHGTTTLDVHTGLGLDDKTELKILRAIHQIRQRPLDLHATFYGAAGLPPDFSGSPDDYLEHLVRRTLPKIHQLELAHRVDIRVGPDGFTAEQAGRYLAAAANLGFSGRVTASEWGLDGGVLAAVRAGARSVDHIEAISPEQIPLLASSGTIATLIPGASFHRRRSVYAPARALIDAGAAVAIASGYSSDRCPSCNMGAIISLACNQMRMTPAEAVTAATINAAHATSAGDRTGSLEYGKDADLIMLNVSDYREIPYHFGMNLVAMMMKRGDVIYPRVELPWSNA